VSKPQRIPVGYYTSNTKDCDVFCVKDTTQAVNTIGVIPQKTQSFYFRKDSGKYSVGADIKWSVTNRTTFDHCVTVTDSATVEAGDDVTTQYSDKGGRGFYVSASVHYGATAGVKTKWAYHDSSGDSVSVWGGVSDGPGGNVSGCAGVWYDNDGDLHVKFGLGGVIPECPDFGVSAVISKKTLANAPATIEDAIDHQVSEGGKDLEKGGKDLEKWTSGIL
jgi:hypothetical protein